MTLGRWPWPWRLFSFSARATRREYWSIMLPVSGYVAAFVTWDEARRPNGGPPDELGLLGALLFFGAAIIGTCTAARRLADLEYPAESVAWLIGIAFAVQAIAKWLTRSDTVAEVVMGVLLAAAIGILGFPRGVRGGSLFGPDPRGRKSPEDDQDEVNPVR